LEEEEEEEDQRFEDDFDERFVSGIERSLALESPSQLQPRERREKKEESAQRRGRGEGRRNTEAIGKNHSREGSSSGAATVGTMASSATRSDFRSAGREAIGRRG
jgi:hypothetical protein